MKNKLKYYKVYVRLGHVGTGKYAETCLFFASKSIIEAIDLAKHTPGVKHRLLPFKAIEISKEDYILGKQIDHYKTTMDSI